MEPGSLSQGYALFLKDGEGAVSLSCRTQSQLFDEGRIKAFVGEAQKADVVVIALHGSQDSFPAHEAFAAALEAGALAGARVHVQPSATDVEGALWAQKYSTDFGSEAYEKARLYLLSGGRDNFRSLLRHFHNLATEGDLPLDPPYPQPFDGIYHPDFPPCPALGEYLALRRDPQKPTVGLWFHQAYYLNGNLKHIDALIRAIERKGANVIPVFHLRHKDRDLRNDGALKVAQKYFLGEDGAPLVDAILSNMSFSMTLTAPETKSLYRDLNVPVLQATASLAPRAAWAASAQGLCVMDVSLSAAQPEFDGNIIAPPFAFREEKEIDPLTQALTVAYIPDEERTDKLASLAVNWASLAKTPVRERKIAIVFHHYPPRNDRIGCAAGLDSFQSVVAILKALKESGYFVENLFEGENELARALLSKLTSDKRFLTPEAMSARAEARAGRALWSRWHQKLPPKVREKTVADWGEPPGDLFTYRDEMLFAGLSTGNVFISVQPPRGNLEKIDSLYHDLYITPPHQYHAQYRHLKESWGAQAFIHVGKHGSLEWLPGKALGLSEECHPDIAIQDVPNIYPYVINDPGEGTQAKRRSYAAIVDHLPPALTQADLYGETEKVEALVGELRLAEREDPAKAPILQEMIVEEALKAKLDRDLDLTAVEMAENFEEFLEKLHGYLHELSDSLIARGLHVLGKAPEGDELAETLVELTRIEGPGAPSLRETLIRAQGHDPDALIEWRGKPNPAWDNRSGANILAETSALSLRLVAALLAGDPSATENDVAENDAEENGAAEKPKSFYGALSQEFLGNDLPPVREALRYIKESLLPRILQTPDEIENCLKGLAGGFIPPGPSGAPSRGQCDILPTGRNFYSVDPRKIPSPAAWKVGVALGDALIARALQDFGRYPENVGILLYGTSAMRTRGDDVAEILYLMGLRPVWREGGSIGGLTVIPLAELKRPRLDVTARISGFFRDSFPNLVELLDRAVKMVATLNETPETNYTRAHVLADLDHYAAEGLGEKEAFREATFRLFGCPPGTYGAGVAELVESRKWRNASELGEIYVRYGGHAYGEGAYGLTRPQNFRRALSRMDVTVKNEDSREYDMMSCVDYYNYYGGLIAAAETVRGVAPLSLVGDASDPKRVAVRHTQEEAKRVLRTRLVNPKWIAGIQRHGYKGAGDLSHMTDVMFGWDATAKVMEDWMYQKVSAAYVHDPQMKEWMLAVNPFARQNILEKLLEAIARGMWDAGEEETAKLREEYLELEGRLEDWNDAPENAGGAADEASPDGAPGREEAPAGTRKVAGAR
jgi:cobaltochelatase CobN